MSTGMMLWQTGLAALLAAPVVGAFYAGSVSLWLAPAGFLAGDWLIKGAVLVINTLICDFCFDGDEEAFIRRVDSLQEEFFGDWAKEN